MSAIFEDGPVTAKHVSRDLAAASSLTDPISLRVLEWRSKQPQQQQTDIPISSARELIARDEANDCDLRIILAPHEPRHAIGQRAILAIYEHYDVSSALQTIKTTSPTHAFGHRRGLRDPNVEVAWTRFLCKDILPHSRQAFHDNFLWLVCDAYLHVRQRKDKHDSRCVTLLCFGAQPRIIQRFERLLKSDAWADAVQEPYILFALVYEQLFLILDGNAWTLASWFRGTERGVMNSSRQEQKHSRAEPADFAMLHEIAKQGIYMSEAATAAVIQMENIITYLRESSASDDNMREIALQQFTYQKSAFRSTQLRLSSLDKRIANIISLSFNLVAQIDSQTMRQDSSAMKSIAILTLIFLPLTGIASLFSTPFFDVEGPHLFVSVSIWIFWVVTVCLTLLIVAFWLWWYRSIKEKTANVARRKQAEKLG